MKHILNYDEYIGNNQVNEGLIHVIKAKSKMTKVAGAIMDKAAELIEKNPDRFNEYNSVIKYLYSDAKKLYDKELGDLVKNNDIIDFDDWWESFAPKAEQEFINSVTKENK